MDEFLMKASITATSSIVVEPVKHILNTWLKPKLESMKAQNEMNEKLETFVFDVFADYIKKTYDEHNSVNIIALGLQQIKINQIYVPVTLHSEEKNEKVLIDRYPTDIANSYRKIVIEDTAGMGKSTLMKKMFISVIEHNLGIPIFIELRNLAKDKNIIEYILDNLNGYTIEHSMEFILEVINRGDFIFFLDGYDEIPLQQKQEVTKSLKKFISNASENTFFLTSRPDDSLMSFGQFQKFDIMDLTEEEAFELIARCDTITGLNLSDRIIKQIKEYMENVDSSTLESFLANPLLVSFLYITFKHKNDIPSLKIDLYRKVFDALYELHDLSKDSYKREKYSGLSSSNLQKILMKLGFLCIRENDNDYDKGKLIKLISHAKDSPYFNGIQEDSILQDLVETVPLFTKIGLGYKWAHKSFMDYFAAYFIDYQDSREKILTDIYNSNHFTMYFNLIDFYYEIDRRLFDKVFIYPIIQKFIKYIESSQIDTSKDYEKLRYLEMIFNRFFIFNLQFFDYNQELSFGEKTNSLINLYRVSFPHIKDYRLTRSVESSTGEGSYLLCKESRIESILRLLLYKKNPLVREIDMNGAEDETLVFSWEHTDINQLTNSDIESRIKLIEYTFGERGRGRSTFIALDFNESLKYKMLIEAEMSKSEDNLFLNL